jgi:DNA repair exonuclease SbcCD nuclease subunit
MAAPMKIICVADLHLTDNPLDEYRHRFMQDVLPAKAKALDVDAVVILGDLTEAKDKHSSVLVNSVVSHLDLLSYAAPVVILMGNHDYSNEGFPFFQFVDRIKDIHFISTVTEGEELHQHLSVVFKNCIFLPHSRDPERDWKGLRFDKYDYVFAHQAFQNAETGFGHKLEGYPVDRFMDTRVIAGDIHKPQKVGPVTYIGAPYTVDFGDSYKARALFIDINKVRDVPLELLPQKKLITIERDAPDLLAVSFGVNEGDVCRIRVEVDNLNDWPEILKHIRKQASTLNLKIESIAPVMLKRAKAHRIKPVSGDSKKSDAELVRQFAERERLDDATLDAGLNLVEDR